MRLKESKMMIVMSFALAVVLASLVVAQQGADPGEQKRPGQQMMTMDEMMQECRKHCQETAKSIDQMTKMIDEAEQSNDPARAQTALGQARKSLAEMKNHMDMMEKMHGKGRKKQ